MAGSEERVVVGPDPRTCPHETLMPRWRGPEVMGEEGGAMGYVCHRCHSEFSPDAAWALRGRPPGSGEGM